jgi:hypothetical protein
MRRNFEELTQDMVRSITRRLGLRQLGLRLAGLANGILVATFSLGIVQQAAADTAPAHTPTTIPWYQIGAKAGTDYKGDGLAVVPTAEGARLCCVFQRLEGEATREGLWLTSTVTNGLKERFRVIAAAVRRQCSPSSFSSSSSSSTLERAGTVSMEGQTVRFIRPGLTEEYTVSMDGVRQDFLLTDRPGGAGELVINLVVSGAKTQPAPGGARLALENSGRKMAYARLRATDASGKELPARMEVASPTTIALVVGDIDALYPVRVDPTFSDANWISMGGIPGAENSVYAAVVDGSGNLYIGGLFTVVGDVVANRVANWNGSSWSALGAGLNGPAAVYALAVSGTNLYAAGYFTNAGGVAATNIAKWNGSNWSALGLGIGDPTSEFVNTLAVSGSDVYVGGDFTTAGGSPASYIAKWDGGSWSALGSGMDGAVWALAMSGSDLYAGGDFTTAGGSPADYVAKWNGSSWSALGSGTDWDVGALAVWGSDLYVGGEFYTAGNITANRIAKWDGSSWSALGSGMDGTVWALAVSGSALYVGGSFSMAGPVAANGIAKWDGSNWSALGSGIGAGYAGVFALAVSGNDLYVGGAFTRAGAKASAYLARAIVNPPLLGIEPDGFGGFLISFSGVPGSTYRLQRAPTLNGPWISSAPQIAPASGLLQFWDFFPPPGQGFYRTVQP